MTRSATRNLQSAGEYSFIVQQYLDREEHLGRVQRISAHEEALLPTLQISPFGVIPKRYQPDKWRLIIDLSSPHGHSINDAISKDLSSVSYTSLDDAAAFIQQLGAGCLMAKLDLKEAYRAVPVHPADQPRLAMRWQNTVYMDRALPFGLRSAPKLFSALTDGLMWMLYCQGVQYGMHYLDDFLLLGPADSQACKAALECTLATCARVGLPVAPGKTEGPTTRLTFLGIEIDTVANEVRLPSEKLQRLQSELEHWMGRGKNRTPRRSGTKRDLLSLIGLLTHAAKVVRPGRAFTRNLINASTTVDNLEHRVHLPKAAREDIVWWYSFLQVWNGVSMLPSSTPDQYITSDASGSWGCGVIYQNLWIQVAWPSQWADVSIAPKEMAPIVMAVALWGLQWKGTRVCSLCDNATVVHIINKKAARDPILARLLRVLCILCAVYDITLTARHLPGVQNTAADALSRNRLHTFFSLNPQASPVTTVIPPSLQDLVFNNDLPSSSPIWTRQWITTLAFAWRQQHARHMPRPRGVTLASASASE